MFLYRTVAAALILGLLASPTALANQRDRDTCENDDDLHVAIAACTRVINDKRESKGNRADAYYNRGYSYTDLEQYDRAIADFNQVLKIDPKDVDAFIERAYAYARKGQFDQAMADYNRAIRVKPDEVDSYHQRAAVFAAKGDFTAAIDDYTQQIKLDPKEADAYLSRGIARVYNNALGDAQADFKESLKVDEKFGFAMLWLDIAERRNRLPSRFDQLTSQFDSKDWPAPLISLFRGQGTIADAIVEASRSTPPDRTFDLCEAHFYGGQWALINDDRSAAVEHFRAANGICYKTVVEWYASREELKALGVSP